MATPSPEHFGLGSGIKRTGPGYRLFVPIRGTGIPLLARGLGLGGWRGTYSLGSGGSWVPILVHRTAGWVSGLGNGATQDWAWGS